MATTARSVTVTPLTTYPGSLRRNAPRGLVNRWREASAHHLNRAEGVYAIPPTTPSVQSGEPGAQVDWNIDLTVGIAVVAGVALSVQPTADFDICHGSKKADIGQSVVAAIVAKNDAGTVSLVAVLGAAATTGNQVPPTDAEIATALGAGVAWIRLAHCTYNHTGDGTMTQSQNNAPRPLPGVTVHTGENIAS